MVDRTSAPAVGDMARWLMAAAFVAALVSFWAASSGEDAVAAGPCGTTHDALDSEEQQFLNLLQQWRLANVSSEPVEVSGALNQAAAWFAEWQVSNSALGGHSDSFGRSQGQRAIDCGYTAKTSYGVYWASVAGEGVYSTASGAGPAQALQAMISQSGSQSGIYMIGFPNFPAKCYGVGVFRSGQKVAWVVVIAQLPASLACPAGAGGGAPGTPPSTNSPPAPTKTPAPTATPIPVFRSWFSQLSKD